MWRRLQLYFVVVLNIECLLLIKVFVQSPEDELPTHRGIEDKSRRSFRFVLYLHEGAVEVLPTGALLEVLAQNEYLQRGKYRYPNRIPKLDRSHNPSSNKEASRHLYISQFPYTYVLKK